LFELGHEVLIVLAEGGGDEGGIERETREEFFYDEVRLAGVKEGHVMC
jgi:hypothetical protein